MKLLSNGIQNHKIKKNIKLGYLTFSLNLAHSNLSGYNVCAKAKKLIQDPINKSSGSSKLADCSATCVAGNGFASIYSAVLESRIKKTIAFKKDTKFFLNSLAYEIQKAINQAQNKNLIPTFRLNAYSDICWERYTIKDNKNIFELFPGIDFYDYSKLLNRKVPSNYQLTYSHYGNWNETKTALNQGLNVAMVFQALPKQITINNTVYTVISGDASDLRLNEKINNKPVIVGLKFKGSKVKLSSAIAGRFAIPLKETYYYYV